MMSQPNLHQTIDELQKLNTKSGITTDVSWLEYLYGVYANATIFEEKKQEKDAYSKLRFTYTTYKCIIFVSLRQINID